MSRESSLIVRTKYFGIYRRQNCLPIVEDIGNLMTRKSVLRSTQKKESNGKEKYKNMEEDGKKNKQKKKKRL